MKTKKDIEKLADLIKTALDWYDKAMPEGVGNIDKAHALAGYLSVDIELTK